MMRKEISLGGHVGTVSYLMEEVAHIAMAQLLILIRAVLPEADTLLHQHRCHIKLQITKENLATT
jgi:hypothetical protein